MNSKLISRPSFIVKLKKGNAIAVTGAEIANILGDAKYEEIKKELDYLKRLNSRAPRHKKQIKELEEELKKADKSYEKQYKSSEEFRNIYNSKLEEKYTKDFKKDDLSDIGTRAAERQKYQDALLGVKEENGEKVKIDKEAIAEAKRDKEDKDINNYIEALKTNTAPISYTDAKQYTTRLGNYHLFEDDRKNITTQVNQDRLRRLTGERRVFGPDGYDDPTATYKDASYRLLSDRLGEAGMNALRFMKREGNNLLASNYLQGDAAGFVGNLEGIDMNEFDTIIKNHRNKKSYDDLIKQMNEAYGTNFRNRADVAAFQQLVGQGKIRVDGIIGPQTEALLQYYYGQKMDNPKDFDEGGIGIINKKRMYSGKDNEDVYDDTMRTLVGDNYNETDFTRNNIGDLRYQVRDDFNVPLSLHSKNSSGYSDWVRHYTTGQYSQNMNDISKEYKEMGTGYFGEDGEWVENELKWAEDDKYTKGTDVKPIWTPAVTSKRMGGRLIRKYKPLLKQGRYN